MNEAERIKAKTEELKPLWPKGTRVSWDHFGMKRFGEVVDIDGHFIRVKPSDEWPEPIWLDHQRLEKVSA
ncbi:hypothetical protein HWB90_gp049 [Mycobacterium phage Fowlmouth]|uniref:Uncharacterized protein n=2 Tax=Fowlmouthvirus fowlmouth TaxID=2845652 RepID=A0A7G8LPU0_9CAUD|nr:hypothetical protein HWB90_gp049 [Mycobacterium phage Fowlmouth]AYN57999.1 hypothetical protein SEA_FOWLMOUTH_49 [Mycobacterium phage Fowlmouth]QNJ59262.1 hypothetical protein SEA_MRMIYAGI_48 [Mycobacterium phage MrMiyagi]